MTTLLPNDVDVLVVGTGATGLVAALSAAHAGARVLVIESAGRFGGTTALGGGRVWIPANGTPENAGDSPQLAATYLRQVFDPRYPAFIDAFVAGAPAMREFVEANSVHRFVVCPNYPDYHQDREGSTAGGRTFDVAPVNTRPLAPECSNILTPPGYTPITHAQWEQWRFPQRFDQELIQTRRDEGVLTGGPGLVAALMDGVIRAGATVTANAELVDLDVDGTITATVRTGGVEVRLNARAVILASGGFDASSSLRESLMTPALGTSASAPTNTGIALAVARKLNLAVDNVGEGWWMPMMSIPGDAVDGVPYPRALIRERGLPHQIIVNRAGERFVDEAAPYNEIGKAIHARSSDGGYPNRDAFIVVDEDFRQNYSLPALGTAGTPSAPYVTADTLEELAEKLGLPPANLIRTAERWNELCANGIDTDFDRGENAYDRYYGDPWSAGNRNLGPVSRAPFYAAHVFSATIGSKGGPITTLDGEALKGDGSVVDGLYVVGTAAAFWTADGYPGPGAPLALGMTFGYRSGIAAARRASNRRLTP
jgi:3-oxosteroid 1-dehydrogenase